MSADSVDGTAATASSPDAAPSKDPDVAPLTYEEEAINMELVGRSPNLLGRDDDHDEPDEGRKELPPETVTARKISRGKKLRSM